MHQPLPLWHPPEAILQRRYNDTIAKRRDGSEGQALSFRKQELYNLLKTQGSSTPFYYFLRIDEDYQKKYVKWNNLYDIVYKTST